MQDLKGKKAIVTGGSRGLGKAVALSLAQQGVDVAIIGRNETTLIEAAGELAQYDTKILYAEADVTNVEAIQEAVNYFKEEFGTIDILINNAGISAFGNFVDMDTQEWINIMNVNVMGIYYITKAVLPIMIEQKSGDIINVSSTAGLTGNATTSAYSASKFAVIGMTESIMKEVRKHNIRVSTLTPSTIATDMSQSLGILPENTENMLQPEDFAELVSDILKMNQRALIKSASIWTTNP